MNPVINQLTDDYKCCKRCIGRCIYSDMEKNLGFTKYSELPDNIKAKIVEHDECEICMGLIENSLQVHNRLIHALNRIEFNNFLVGVMLPGNIDNELLYTKYGLQVLSVKQTIANEFGIRIKDEYECEIVKEDPDLTIIIDLLKKPRFDIQIKSLYFLGKYKKLVRGIPQTKWPCSKCRGRGCSECDNTGQQYKFTVEGIVSKPFKKLAGSNFSSFHGAGREDIDALMLGTGRPFVLEIKNPSLRSFDFKDAINSINNNGMVKISDVRVCDKSYIKLIKSSSPNASKVYHATVTLLKSANEDILKNLNIMGKQTISLKQRTPQRVSHRRADLIRDKKIFSYKIIKIINEVSFILEIHAQGGAYIKEFISGDNGRTIPSISEFMNNEAICTALDVIKVDDKGIF